MENQKSLRPIFVAAALTLLLSLTCAQLGFGAVGRREAGGTLFAGAFRAACSFDGRSVSFRFYEYDPAGDRYTMLSPDMPVRLEPVELSGGTLCPYLYEGKALLCYWKVLLPEENVWFPSEPEDACDWNYERFGENDVLFWFTVFDPAPDSRRIIAENESGETEAVTLTFISAKGGNGE